MMPTSSLSGTSTARNDNIHNADINFIDMNLLSWYRTRLFSNQNSGAPMEGFVVKPDSQLVTAEAEGFRAHFLNRMREVPGAVALIATVHEGKRGGLAATAWCSLSADPPTMLVCVNRNASAHDAIVASGLFSVNQLATVHEEIVAIFSNQRGLQGSDRFLEGDWQDGSRGTPLLRKAVTAYECAVVGRMVYETHSLFIGQVVDMIAPGEVADPAAFFKGALCGVAARQS
jgi:flavin reductase (DIM6/NTAB) family NADH-FMN oxidoreductase RutF